MDVFIQRLPSQATQRAVRDQLRQPLADVGAETYSVEKRHGKTFGKLSILDTRAAQWFLYHYGVPRDSRPHVLPRRQLFWDGRALRMWEDRFEISTHAVQALQLEESRRASERARPSGQHQSNLDSSRFTARVLRCGSWVYTESHLAFTPFYEDHRPATVIFGTRQVVILLHSPSADEQRIYCQYFDIDDIVLGAYDDPTVSMKLRVAPKFYKTSSGNDLAAAMSAMNLGASTSGGDEKKLRLTSLDHAHSKVVSTCFVYRITLADRFDIGRVRSLLNRNPRVPTTTTLSTPTIPPTRPLDESFQLLDHDLTDQCRYGYLPFSLLFQTSALAKNGTLHPRTVRALLPGIAEIFQDRGSTTALAALRRFATQIPCAGPGVEAETLSTQRLQDVLFECADEYDRFHYDPEDPYQLAERYRHINLIHKIVVTPVGTYLTGPHPEPTNRVLRKRLLPRYDPRADQREVYGRFKQLLEGTVSVAGRPFSFLGFSHSSLRAQSVWCMSPFFYAGTLQIPELVLKALGEFSSIRVPAKCAARIGQNFTDTNATIELQPGDVTSLAMVQRNGRDFSDDVGTISREMLELVWRVYGTRRLLKPSLLQIRFQGHKGMVSLDSRLRGKRIMLRENMKKFEAPSAWFLEICGAGFRPLPMILNRQLIKLLEDLDIPANVFMELQATAVHSIRMMTASAINTSHFLERADTTRATRVPYLIRKLGQIGLDYRQDPFLYRVVEMIVITKLRDIKYRGRIAVEKGVTLYGIMDETGFLQEGEIYVTTENTPRGGRWELIQDRVAVTRSPVMHPGDVQVVRAVGVPANSPLRSLRNAVVFSQHGARDLPSMLSGGDLDGDLYNVIWDHRLVPATTHQPADYPRVSAVELDRAVMRKDMSDFFVSFMQTDQLGMLSNIHLQLADQRELGTLDYDCIKLAHLASISVDFSKTGIPVDMKGCPRRDRIRPDFMAPSPRVFIEEHGPLQFEDDQAPDETVEDLDVEVSPMRYYRSQKVLGRLYREIDEQQFLLAMQQEHEALLLSAVSSSSLPEKLLQYMLRQAAQFGIMFDQHSDLAVEIRYGYEDSLLDLLQQHGPSSHQPATEYEAFAGCILGRRGGAQGKPLRELSKKLREQFESVCDYTTMRIVKGDAQMQGAADLDELYDESDIDREVEALPRAIACLKNAVEEQGATHRRVGELQSFKYIAAAVCMSELERLRAPFGSTVLPRV